MAFGFKLGLGLSQRGGGGGAFGVTITGLTDGEARIGSHASIGYTETPTSATETVKWSNSSDPAAAATYGTGASPTDYTAGDEGSLWLHVTDDGETVSRSAPIRYAPGAFAALTNQSFEENGGNETYVFAAATGANLTWTYSLVSPPAGVTINSGTRTITFDTDTLAIQSGTVITVRAVDQYGRNPGDRTFTLAITEADVTAPIISVVSTSNVGSTTADWSVTTNEAGGTVYVGARPSGSAALTAAQLQAGTGGAGVAFDNATPAVSG